MTATTSPRVPIPLGTAMSPTRQIDPDWREVRRVLAVRLDNLGDVLVTTPALHAIKQSLPQATLTLLASPVGAQVARLNPDVDVVIVYEAPWMDPWHTLPQESAREERMIAELRAHHFDGAIIFTSYHQSPLPAAYLCYLADIPLRVAASIDGPGSLLTTRHKHPERMMHEVERGLNLVGAIGLGTEERDLVLRVPEEARRDLTPYPLPYKGRGTGASMSAGGEVSGRQEAGGTGVFRTAIASQGVGARQASTAERDYTSPLVVVHPGCSMPARTYPEEMYSEVIELLVRRLGATVMVTGAPDERELVARVVSRVSAEVRAAVTPVAGELAFRTFCAMIEVADLTITNNTGPMHIAAALKTPVVALFALTNPPDQWGPWHVPHRQLYVEVPCRICYSRICPYGHECLRLVTPSMVVEAAEQLLAETRTKRAARSSARRTNRAVGAMPIGHQASHSVGARPVSPAGPISRDGHVGQGSLRKGGSR